LSSTRIPAAQHPVPKLETALLSDRLDRHGIYSSLAAEVEQASILSDAALAMGALVKPVALAGYEIAKPISKRNEAIRGKIVKALDFYGGRALAAAATRRANASKGPKGGGLILIFRG
jgi:predicted nicotinamide N-methyase